MNMVRLACSKDRPVGILAGCGIFPTLLARALDARSDSYVVAGLLGQTEGRLFPRARAYTRVGVGEFEQTARFFSGHGARGIYFAGGVTRKGVWRHLRPDRIGARLFRFALLGGDDALLTRCAEAFSTLDIEVLDPGPLLPDVSIAPGLAAGPLPSQRVLSDLDTARTAALHHGARDRGQAAIAFGGEVLGLEDRSGTDALILLKGRPGAALVKMVKPAQDRRFDLPAVGVRTVETARNAGLGAVGVEAFGVLVLERDAVFRACDDAGISLYGLTAPP